MSATFSSPTPYESVTRSSAIVVGSGIGGLYWAYRYVKEHVKSNTWKNKRLVVLEKSNRYGGRVCTMPFAGIRVIGGAGVGRALKDRLLYQFVQDLGLSDDVRVLEGPDSNIQYQKLLMPLVSEFEGWVETLKHKATRLYIANPESRAQMTFKRFATQALGGGQTYDSFVAVSGYTDYENADYIDTVFNYGFDDVYNNAGRIMFTVPWDKMIAKIVSFLRAHGVIIIRNTPGIYIVKTEGGKMGVATSKKGLFIADDTVVLNVDPNTAARMIAKAVPHAHREEQLFALAQIRSQPFLRLYVMLNREYIPFVKTLIKGYMVVNNVLQKILPIDRDKGIYMLAYSDNESALQLQHVADLSFLSVQLCNALSIAPAVTDMITDTKQVFWAEGTHYYAPLQPTRVYHDRGSFLEYVKNPMGDRSVQLVGEAYSEFNQGWTEGALESVHEHFSSE